jgi:RHS repeat-associated protein
MLKTRPTLRIRTRSRRCVRAKSASFTYNANGNRLTSIQTTGSGAAAQTVKRTYTVDPTSNRLLGFTQTQLAGTATIGATSNVNYTHDVNGAMLKDGLRSYEFDAANRLADVTTGVGIDAPTTRYVHNALGQRLFKTEPLYAPVSSASNPADPGVMQTLANFFASLWGGNTTTAAPSASEKLGYTYYYDEDGSLLYEQGSGGANSTGSSHYVYLPTPAGPMPIATYTGSKHYAVQTDHLNTPRRLTNSAKQVAWQWAFSAFGDEQPTLARNRFVDPATTPNAGTTTVAEVTFNLRYPGQYFDKESGLSYNYFRSYDSRTGRYSQSDPIGLQGGWNKFAYVEGNPLSASDPEGLASTTYTRPIEQPLLGGGGGGGVGGAVPFPLPGRGTGYPTTTFKRPKFPSSGWGNDGADSGGESWPKGDDWRGQCIRLYAQCKNYGWTGSCDVCLNKCTAQQEWPFDGPGACKPKKKNGNSCEAGDF